MDKNSPNIEFKKISFNSDHQDLSQECTAYMKTKQFMAKRIHEQQEEIDMLKQNLIYHSGKHMQISEQFNNMKCQIELLKENFKSSNKFVKSEFDLSNEDLASSFVIEDHFESRNPKLVEEEIKILSEENFEIRKEIEKLRLDVIDKSIELNKTKSDKFILYNELNELVQSLKKVDMDKLNTFYKSNTSEVMNKFEMPLAKGIKFNILSAQSQLCKFLVRDSISKKLNLNFNEETDRTQKQGSCFDSRQMDVYLEILKKTDEEFENLLDRKLAKRSKSFINNGM